MAVFPTHAASPAPAADLHLPEDHPGFSDRAYIERRAAIAAACASYERGGPIPDVHYTRDEDEVWRLVSTELAELHRMYACQAYLDAVDKLVLPETRVPQLSEVDSRLESLTGFRLRPVSGLVPTRLFYGALAERIFHSTQYIRHHSVPFYTPEPDIVHEIIGHANTLASNELADLYVAAGNASLRATSDAAHEFFSKVFWFTLEFGVLHEGGQVRAYGAGLLSSYGEIQVFRNAEIRPWDIVQMGTLEYDITQYQPVLFAAESFTQMLEELTVFFDSYDDDRFN
ncbi:MAG: phenylalanine 4-monooxygenase, partial [Acidimicrobiales bacterium]